MATYPADWASTMQPALHEWVSGVLDGWSVIWAASQGPGASAEGPRPARPFATIQIIAGPNPTGQTAEASVDVGADRMDLRIDGPATIQVEIQLFQRDRSPTAARQLAFSISRETYRASLRSAGLSPFEFVETRDLSQISGGEREGRYSVEVTFALQMQRTLQDQPFVTQAGAVFSPR